MGSTAKYIVATASALIAAIMTLTVGHWQSQVGDFAGETLTMMLFPGLLPSALTGSLVPGAIVNGVLYFGVVLLAVRIFGRKHLATKA